MKPTETIIAACLAVGIEPDLAHAAALAHARIVHGTSSKQSTDFERRIAEAFNFTNPPTRRMTATEVCKFIGITSPTRAEQTAVGVALAALTKRRALKSNGRHYYVLPAE